MAYVAGIDQSARHTGVCILDEQGQIICLELIEPGPRKDQRRLAFIRSELNQLLAPYELIAVVMEGYSYNSTNKKFLLGEIGSVVKLSVYDKDAELYEAAPKQLKKFVAGRGNADKNRVMRAVAKLWGVNISNDNLADAYGLAQISREIVWPSSTRRYQLDVVKSITKKDLKKQKRTSIKPVRNAI